MTEFLILFPLPSQSLDNRAALPCLVYVMLETEPWDSCMLGKHSTNRATPPKVERMSERGGWDKMQSVGWVSTHPDNALQRRNLDPQRHLGCVHKGKTTWGHSGKAATCKLRFLQASAETKPAHTWSETSAPNTVRNKQPLFENRSVGLSHNSCVDWAASDPLLHV